MKARQVMVGQFEPVKVRQVVDKILVVHGQRVILDADLAVLYGVTTKRLNEQVKRNKERFPADFIFKMTSQEIKTTLSGQCPVEKGRMRSQIATASKRNVRFSPFAYTEHGAIMADTVLNSRRAVQMSVFVVRAFVSLRRLLVGQEDLAVKVADLEHRLTKRMDVHETAITEVLQQVMRLIDPPDLPEPPKKKIGFLTE